MIRNNFGGEYSLYKSKQSSKDFKLWEATRIKLKQRTAFVFAFSNELGLIKPLRER